MFFGALGAHCGELTIGKIHPKADCGTVFMRLRAEIDVDVPVASPDDVKRAALPRARAPSRLQMFAVQKIWIM